VIYGSIALVVGFAGSITGGLWAGALIRARVQDATMRVVLYGTLVLLPTATLLTIVPNPWVAMALLVPVTFCMALPPGLMMATLQAVAPNEMRGQMVGVYLIVVNFLAYTFAPSLPALMSDYVFGSELALGKSISVLAVINYSICALCLGAGLKHYRAALEEAKAWAM
jgi:MFS family permease